MNDWLYVMFIEKTKTYNRLTKAAVERHVENLRALDDQGHLELCGGWYFVEPVEVEDIAYLSVKGTRIPVN